eukprot:jgi/Mesvir1/22587/Mv05008-RA.1
MANLISHNAIAKLGKDSDITGLVFQVLDVTNSQSSAGRPQIRVKLSDGTKRLDTVFGPCLKDMVDNGEFEETGVIRIKQAQLNENAHGSLVMILLEAEVVSRSLGAVIGNPSTAPAASAAVKAEASNKSKAPAAPVAEQTPIAKKPRLSDESRPSPSTSTRLASSRRVQPIESLNPYFDKWTIKARVTSKGDLRSYKNARGEGQVFSVELTDEQGTQIQATMFREAADKFFELLQLNKVYYITGGKLRMANRNFTNVNNQYEMTLGETSIIEECEDAECVAVPKAVYHLVPIPELGLHLPAPDAANTYAKLVDVLGVVTSVGNLDEITRKSDGKSLPKRDVTIADSSAKTVTVTLWNKLAEEFEGDVNSVIAIRGVRPSDFNGISLSTVTKSQVILSPDCQEAVALREWWEAEGGTAHLEPLSAGMAMGGGAQGRGARSAPAVRKSLLELSQHVVTGDKPEYFNTRAVITFVKKDAPLWYNACPTDKCNKKVTDDGSGQFHCEGCQKSFPNFTRRFVTSLLASDYSGGCWLNGFHEQVQTIFHSSANELADTMAADPKQYEKRIHEALFQDLSFRVSVRKHEYNGETRQRVTIVAVQPTDPVAESHFLLQEIAKYVTVS